MKRLPSRSLPGPIRNKGHPNTQVRDRAVCYTSRIKRMYDMACSHGQFKTFSNVSGIACMLHLSLNLSVWHSPSLNCPHSPPPHPTSQHKHVMFTLQCTKTVLAHLPGIQLDMAPGSPARPGPLLKRDQFM